MVLDIGDERDDDDHDQYDNHDVHDDHYDHVVDKFFTWGKSVFNKVKNFVVVVVVVIIVVQTDAVGFREKHMY